jgi:transposase-like protein
MRKDARLDSRQIRILEDFFGRSVAGDSMEKVAESHGISRKTLSQWKNTEHGKQLHADWKKEATRDAIPQYYDVLKEKALSGSYKHMELFAKIFDLMSPEKQEIVTKNVENIKEEGISKERMAELKSLIEDTPLKRVK